MKKLSPSAAAAAAMGLLLVMFMSSVVLVNSQPAADDDDDSTDEHEELPPAEYNVVCFKRALDTEGFCKAFYKKFEGSTAQECCEEYNEGGFHSEKNFVSRRNFTCTSCHQYFERMAPPPAAETTTPQPEMWSPWGLWRCGKANSKTRKRTCEFGDTGCKDGQMVEHKYELSDCGDAMVDGGWSRWRDWSPCSQTCGYGGKTLRVRHCTRPRPANGGKPCPVSGPGDHYEQTVCPLNQDGDIIQCPVDGVWSDWGNWSRCSVTCGRGQKERSRTCEQPRHGGKRCEGDETDTGPCYTGVPCPEWEKWSPWSEWTFEDDSSCGDATRRRTRICDRKNRPANCKPTGDGPIKIKGTELADEFFHCPVDGGWGSWSRENCVKTGSSKQHADIYTFQKFRECNNPPPAYGGKVCSGVSHQRVWGKGSFSDPHCRTPAV